MTCSLCKGEIPEERLTRNSKYCSDEHKRIGRKLYMKHRKRVNEIWHQTLSDWRKQHSEAGNVVTE